MHASSSPTQNLSDVLCSDLHAVAESLQRVPGTQRALGLIDQATRALTEGGDWQGPIGLAAENLRGLGLGLQAAALGDAA